MRLSILLLSLAASARAVVVEAPVGAARAALGTPATTSAAALTPLPALTPIAAAIAPALTAPAVLSAPAAQAAPMSRDLARDAAAAKLSAAGFDRELAKHGLILWHILSARTRSGDQAYLTVSLPPDGRDYTRENDPKRGAELERRLAAASKRVAAVAAGILGLDENSVGVNARLIENCCGAGCQSCLLTKEAHAEKWTGGPARPERDGSR